MSKELSEEDMRLALFGASKPPIESAQSVPKKTEKIVPKAKSKPLTPKLRVTLRVSKVFEGVSEVFTYDANTLSTFVAEQEAKAEAKKNKFKYFDLVSVKPI